MLSARVLARLNGYPSPHEEWCRVCWQPKDPLDGHACGGCRKPAHDPECSRCQLAGLRYYPGGAPAELPRWASPARVEAWEAQMQATEKQKTTWARARAGNG